MAAYSKLTDYVEILITTLVWAKKSIIGTDPPKKGRGRNCH